MGATMEPEEKEETQGDPNKETMLEPNEGDASEMLPTVGGYEDSDEESPDTGTDTAEADTETDTGEEDPDTALLREHGLDATYKTIPAALAGAREKERYIQEQRVANQQLRDTLSQAYENRPIQQQQPLNEDVAEQFATDPEGTLRKMGYVDRAQITPLVNQIQSVQARLERQEFAETVSQFDDLKDVGKHFRSTGAPLKVGTSAVWDEMMNIYHASPSLASSASADVIPLLYTTAKARLAPDAKVSKVPDAKKRGASTTSTGRGARRPSGGEPDFDKMTEQELYDWHKAKGLVS